MVACADTNEQGEAYFHDMKPGTYMLIQLTHDGQSTGEKTYGDDRGKRNDNH